MTAVPRASVFGRISRGLCALFALLCALAACGSCGGASAGAAAGVSGTPLVLTIDWGARTRDLGGPSSALSLTVTLPNAKPDGTDFIWEIDRDANLAAHATTYTSAAPEVVIPGAYVMSATFYAQAGGSGSVVAAGSGQVVIGADGTGAGGITTQSTIANVNVIPGQTVTEGSTTQMLFTATDANNLVVALSPGSASWFVQSGNANVSITPDGILSYILPGNANVVATVDGISSFPVPVTSISTITVNVTPKDPTMVVNHTLQFNADIQNDTKNQGVTWQVVEQGGGTVSANGLYTAPATPGTYHVSATSVTDTGRSDSTSVVVTAH